MASEYIRGTSVRKSNREPYRRPVHVQEPSRKRRHHMSLGYLLFCDSSSSLGRIGFLVITLPFDFLPHVHTGNSGGQMQGSSLVLKLFLVILSSREWKVIMQSLPPGFKKSMNPSREF